MARPSFSLSFLHFFTLPNSLTSRAPSDPLRCVWFVYPVEGESHDRVFRLARPFKLLVFVTRSRLHLVSRLTDVFSVHTSTRPAQGTKFFGRRAVIDQVRSDAVLPRRNHRATPRLVIFFLITKGLIDVITWQGTCSLSSLNPTASSSCGRQGCTKKLVLIP